jgi:hypothetical protein
MTTKPKATDRRLLTKIGLVRYHMGKVDRYYSALKVLEADTTTSMSGLTDAKREQRIADLKANLRFHKAAVELLLA